MTMNDDANQGLSADELASQAATALPDKEVVSILDLNADINLAIDAAAPIDLAAAANLNVAAPIEGAVGANVLSVGSGVQALTDQGVMITQGIDADAHAVANQDSGIDQGADASGSGTADAGTADAGTAPAGGLGAPAVGDVTSGGTTDPTSGVLSGNLLDVNVNVDANTDIAAPINGAVAANANVAAPIDTSVAANVGSVDSDAISVGQQDAIINQTVTGSADATSDQSSNISQP
ncbi:MAG: hypothetical protein ACJ72L_06295 [Marmoricola sp.]